MPNPLFFLVFAMEMAYEGDFCLIIGLCNIVFNVNRISFNIVYSVYRDVLSGFKNVSCTPRVIRSFRQTVLIYVLIFIHISWLF